MKIGLIGKKIGMSRLFKKDGLSVPVTVIQIESNSITQVKTPERDSYKALQVVSAEKVKLSRVSRALRGHFAKSKVSVSRAVNEFRLSSDHDASSFELGQTLAIDQFSEGDLVDVSAKSKGKGFAGVIKRWNFSTQDATHGNSLSHRASGSIGQCQNPGRVFKGKKMAGRMGNKKVTTQSLQVVKLDQDNGLLLIKGAVPGSKGAQVIIRPAVKSALN